MEAQFYTENSRGWVSYKPELLNQKQISHLIEKCKNDETLERLKSLGYGALTAASALVMFAVSYEVAEIAATFFAVVFMPLSGIPTLYIALVMGIGIGSGVMTGLVSYEWIRENIFSKAVDCWQHADHITNQGHRLSMRQVELLGSRATS